MQSDPKKLIEKNKNLTHSELLKVISHVQREQGEWILHTVMVEDCDVPFKFKRKGNYQSLKGARVNMTYYSEQETVAGMAFEVMKVVRIKRGWMCWWAPSQIKQTNLIVGQAQEQIAELWQIVNWYYTRPP